MGDDAFVRHPGQFGIGPAKLEGYGVDICKHYFANLPTRFERGGYAAWPAPTAHVKHAAATMKRAFLLVPLQ